MISLSNTTAQTLTPGQSITFNTVVLHTGCAECHRANTSFAICGLRLRRVMAKLIMLFILSAILPGSIIGVELRLVSCSTLLRLLYTVKTCQNIALKLTLS